MTEGILKKSRWRLFGASALIVAVVSFGVCEYLGWPFLGGPMQRWLSTALQRTVRLSADPTASPTVRIQLLGGLDITTAYLAISSPEWSTAPHLMVARDARMTLDYSDLWRASRGQPLHIRQLRAAQFDGQLERLADGRASWQFGNTRSKPDSAVHLPTFGQLQVGTGSLRYRDAPLALDLNAKFSLVDGSGRDAGTRGLTAQGHGVYRKLPLEMTLHTAGVLPVIADDGATLSLPVMFKVSFGRAQLSFDGTATDLLHFTALAGHFAMQGPSLAAVGDPVQVTLPTTAPFHAQGTLSKQGTVWHAVLDRMEIGESRLAGRFSYDRGTRVPLLTGRLTGSKLLLADLGPALGAPVRGDHALSPEPAPRAGAGRVLPDRPFDLPTLRAMDADVEVKIAKVDLGSRVLEPLQPLRTHLRLQDGVLTLRDLDARMGQGQLAGTLALDGRGVQALWTADLRWTGVRLERWIHQARDDHAPPYISGRLNGEARVAGQGKSTAAILAHLSGGVRMQLLDGSISHLGVEAAGLDIAQGLGVYLKGDDALVIQCTVADVVAEQGVLRPRVVVMDTRDSTLFLDGSLSLATEALDLRVVVTPKDFSPLALRTPLHLRGTFDQPRVALDKRKLAERLGASAVLAFINPLAALIPMFDIGSSGQAKRDANDCRVLSNKIAARPDLPTPKLPHAAIKRASGSQQLMRRGEVNR